MKISTAFAAVAVGASALSIVFVAAHATDTPGPATIVGAESTPATYVASLPSLSGAAKAPVDAGDEPGEDKEITRGLPPPMNRATVDDGALQATSAPAPATTAGLSFDGLSAGAGGTPQYAPPDTTGAVGATQYVQWTNISLAVYDKTTGALVYGPVAGNTLFTNLGGACATSNDGDPIVQYDKAAQRWVVSQFAVPGGTAGFWECVAVSQTSDATGAWNLYAFPYTQFNDYPKIGVWPDAYYATFNMFNASSYAGARMCAYDRTAMLAGAAATQQCFQLSKIISVLPADLDGSTPPPANSPNYMLTRATTALAMYKFHTDWTTPASSTLTGPITLPVARYSMACKGGSCVPQPGRSAAKLDSMADRLMFRLAYRNIGGTEKMVVNHSVLANRGSGIRWYEIRGMATTPVVFQQGTYSPDSTYRWMGSAAMDKQGNMAVGYSFSSTAKFPGLAYATRLAADAAGTLSAETVLLNGLGSQTGRLDRWGDYTQMSVDPVDDCTFWYVGQYQKATGSYNWTTRISSFKLTACS